MASLLSAWESLIDASEDAEKIVRNILKQDPHEDFVLSAKSATSLLKELRNTVEKARVNNSNVENAHSSPRFANTVVTNSSTEQFQPQKGVDITPSPKTSGLLKEPSQHLAAPLGNCDITGSTRTERNLENLSFRLPGLHTRNLESAISTNAFRTESVFSAISSFLDIQDVLLSMAPVCALWRNKGKVLLREAMSKSLEIARIWHAIHCHGVVADACTLCEENSTVDPTIIKKFKLQVEHANMCKEKHCQQKNCLYFRELAQHFYKCSHTRQMCSICSVASALIKKIRDKHDHHLRKITLSFASCAEPTPLDSEIKVGDDRARTTKGGEISPRMVASFLESTQSVYKLDTGKLQCPKSWRQVEKELSRWSRTQLEEELKERAILVTRQDFFAEKKTLNGYTTFLRVLLLSHLMKKASESSHGIECKDLRPQREI